MIEICLFNPGDIDIDKICGYCGLNDGDENGKDSTSIICYGCSTFYRIYHGLPLSNDQKLLAEKISEEELRVRLKFIRDKENGSVGRISGEEALLSLVLGYIVNKL